MVLLENYKDQWLDIRTKDISYHPIIRDQFVNIILYSDLPYYFHLKKDEYLRYTGYHYGYFYNKHERIMKYGCILVWKKIEVF